MNTTTEQQHVKGTGRTIRALMIFCVVAFAVSIATAASLFWVSLGRIDESTCRIRNGVVGFVDDTLERSFKASEATIASPNATELQKRVAQENLEQLRDLIAREHHSLSVPHCPFPMSKGVPSLPPTTKPRRFP